MTALGAWNRFCAAHAGIEVVATNAVKCDAPTLELIQTPITPVVIDPQKAEHPE
jgi:hypothetical protein